MRKTGEGRGGRTHSSLASERGGWGVGGGVKLELTHLGTAAISAGVTKGWSLPPQNKL